jgi:hypothetical protein
MAATTMAVDAFSPALTNPRHDRNMLDGDTFSKAGRGVIAGPSALSHIVKRNHPDESTGSLAGLPRMVSPKT